MGRDFHRSNTFALPGRCAGQSASESSRLHARVALHVEEEDSHELQMEVSQSNNQVST